MAIIVHRKLITLIGTALMQQSNRLLSYPQTSASFGSDREYINTPNWNRPIVYYDDDDEDYTIAITPVLSTKEPVDSLIMEDEHLDTIPATESDEVIKSLLQDLYSQSYSESEGFYGQNVLMLCLFCDLNSPPLDISKDQFEGFSNSNDDSTSIDDDSFSIERHRGMLEASPPGFELVNLEVVGRLFSRKVGGFDELYYF
ncbi:hypothetical protein Tco_0613382 [Tanacetum coccineum]